jgi:hypothetical protein
MVFEDERLEGKEYEEGVSLARGGGAALLGFALKMHRLSPSAHLLLLLGPYQLCDGEGARVLGHVAEVLQQRARVRGDLGGGGGE